MFTKENFPQNNIYSWLTLYIVSNALIAFIVSLRFYHNLSIPESLMGYTFGITHTIGHLSALSFLIASPLYLLAKTTKNRTLIMLLSIVFSVLALITLLADTFIYQQYHFHINPIVLELFIAGGSEIISFPLSMWLIIFSIFVAFILGQFFLARFINKIKVSTSFIKKVLIIMLMFLLLSHVIHAWGDAGYNRDITKQAKLLPLAYPTTAKSFMAKYGLLNIEANKAQALLKHKKSRNSLHYPLSEINHIQPSKKLNILMVVIDSWRADMLNESVMPNTFAFSQNKINFLNHYSGSNNTRHGMFSLFYGLQGTYWDSILKQQQGPVLLKTLLNQGYEANVFSSAMITLPEFDQTLFVDVPNLRKHSKGDQPWQRDASVVEDYLLWSKNYTNSAPTFSLLFFDAAHGFSIPENYQKPFIPSLKNVNYLALNDDYNAEPFINLYKNSLHYIDTKIAKILNALDDKLEDTIVIITSDHGKEFNDSGQGYWGHNSNYSSYQTAVPLVIHWPNKPAANYTFPTSHLSIVPTLMEEALNVTTSSKAYSSGPSLFKQKQALPWLFFGRTGYYAIKDEKNLYELDRLGNFTIFNDNYQVDNEAKINVDYVQEALHEMSRFYQK